MVGQREQIVAHHGRTADLLVIARPADETDYAAELEFETALVESGRPLLLVPPVCAPEFGARVVIGWNDCVEASRAVAAALPLLGDASTVKIVTIDGGKDAEANGDALAQYLASHGMDLKYVAASDAGRNKCRRVRGCWVKRKRESGATWGTSLLRNGAPLCILTLLAGWRRYALGQSRDNSPDDTVG